MERKKIRDGNHRLGSALIHNKKSIKVYEFTTKQMKNFAICKFRNEEDYWKKYDNLNINDYIELFYKKFCIK